MIMIIIFFLDFTNTPPQTKNKIRSEKNIFSVFHRTGSVLFLQHSSAW